MRIKFSRILTISIIAYALLLAVPSLAQEGAFPSYELQDANNQELNLNDADKPLIYEQDTKPVKNSAPESNQNTSIAPVKSKNSVSNKPVANNNSSAKGNDDALSFNFLYYIIQKYKASDIAGE